MGLGVKREVCILLLRDHHWGLFIYFFNHSVFLIYVFIIFGCAGSLLLCVGCL